MDRDPKPYLEYLDKEMTIMGILSGVAIAAPAGVLSLMFGDKNSLLSGLGKFGPLLVVLGSIACILAAMSFYGQRSLLAWYYGQMCLTQSRKDPSESARLLEYLRDADSWRTWTQYSWGFTAITTGLLEYVSAAVITVTPPSSGISNALAVGGAVIPVLALLVALLQWHVRRRYSLHDHPWRALWLDFSKSDQPPMPHDSVYTRLGPSKEHGEGVLAIRTIPVDTYIFDPDDDELRSIRRSSIDGLDAPVKELYTDFCVPKGDVLLCPSSFNRLTPAWYLNEARGSAVANVAADDDLRFFATREIKAGEELLTVYAKYSS